MYVCVERGGSRSMVVLKFVSLLLLPYFDPSNFRFDVSRDFFSVELESSNTSKRSEPNASAMLKLND